MLRGLRLGQRLGLRGLLGVERVWRRLELLGLPLGRLRRGLLGLGRELLRLGLALKSLRLGRTLRGLERGLRGPVLLERGLR